MVVADDFVVREDERGREVERDELNVVYVAITRAKRNLVINGSVPTPSPLCPQPLPFPPRLTHRTLRKESNEGFVRLAAAAEVAEGEACAFCALPLSPSAPDEPLVFHLEKVS